MKEEREQSLAQEHPTAQLHLRALGIKGSVYFQITVFTVTCRWVMYRSQQQ